MLDAKPHWLANDAPYGEYLVDIVAHGAFLRGAALSTYGEDEFVRLFREDVSAAASLAMMFTRVRLRLAAGKVTFDETLLRRCTSYSGPHPTKQRLG